MNFDKTYKQLVENFSNTTPDYRGRNVYAVFIFETEERETGSLHAVDPNDAVLNFDLWDRFKAETAPTNFENALQQYCNVLKKFEFNSFDNFGNLGNKYVIQKAIDDANKYSHIEGMWYCCISEYDIAFGVEESCDAAYNAIEGDIRDF